VLHASDFMRGHDARWRTENGETGIAADALGVRHTAGEHANHILTLPFRDVLVRFRFQLRINAPRKEGRHGIAGFQEAAVKLAPDRTHTAWIALADERLAGTVDDAPPIIGTRAALALLKSRLKLEVYSGEARFVDFQMWNLTARTLPEGGVRTQPSLER